MLLLSNAEIFLLISWSSGSMINEADFEVEDQGMEINLSQVIFYWTKLTIILNFIVIQENT